MISLKKYLETDSLLSSVPDNSAALPTLPAIIAAYRSALLEMGTCSLDVCPALGLQLKQKLGQVEESLCPEMTGEAIKEAERSVQLQLQEWGRATASHYRQKTGEVKEMLLAMARTADAVGARDQRCASQISEVTASLASIVNLEDLTEIRASIQNSAAELKTSVERMTADGKAAIEELQAEISTYQAKLELAEELALGDTLTGLRNRLAVECQIKKAMAASKPFCVAMLDLDGFKKVNDEHGHLVGDELLKMFGAELKSSCRATDVIGRWGGDEFIILLACGLPEAGAHMERLKEWVCGNYTVKGKYYPMNLKVRASVGLAEHQAGETANQVIGRADAAMYANKSKPRPEAQQP
jgi:diguanylate cyclase (GGDEF)-like protein